MSGMLGSLLDRRPWLGGLAALALVAVVLLPSLGADFVWDDHSQILDSPHLADPRFIPRYFGLNVVQSWGSEGRGAEGVDTYRPLFFVALTAVYAVDGANPFWFHLAVLVAHLGVCALLFALGRRWLEPPWAAAAAVVLFGLHPVTSEAYLWASALSEPLSAAGLLGAVLILDRWGRAESSGRAVIAAVASALVLLAGLLAKEAPLTALPAAAALLVWWRGVRPILLAGWAGAAGLFLAMRVVALGGLQATGDGGPQRLEALVAYPVLLLDGLRALISQWPIGMRTLYWEYRDLPWGWSALATLALAALAALAWRARRTAPLTPASLVVLALMLAPIALVATVPGWGGFGRYLYVPWAFAALALVEAALKLRRHLLAQWPRLAIAPLLVLAAFAATELLASRRALEAYATQENLARTAIEVFPDGPDGWLWLGNVLLEQERLPEARECYRTATRLAPDLHTPRHNLAGALLYTGRPEEALDHLAILERRWGPTPDGEVFAVRALLALGRRHEARQRLEAALAASPGNPGLQTLRTELGLVSAPPPG